MSREFELLGIEPDNLLGFLALLGFHRALDCARPQWHSRVHWKGLPVRPVVNLMEEVGREELLQAAAQGCDELARVHTFGGIKRIKEIDKERARQMLRDASLEPERLRADLLSAIVSDVALKRDGELQKTPLYAVSGQQGFFDRLENIAKGVPPEKSKITREFMTDPRRLEEALFKPWDRKDYTDAFRWDPIEDRRYALRFNDPSPEGAGATVHGANRLACLALPLLTVVPQRARGEIRLSAVGATSEPGRQVQIRWPIWSRPATLNALRYILASGAPSFPGLGIVAVYVSTRINVEKYFNFTRAVVGE